MSIFSNFFKKEAPLLGLQGSGGGLGFLAGSGPSFEATGGNIDGYEATNGYTYHVFWSNGSLVTSGGDVAIDAIVVGKGGSSCPRHGGGGGGGGVAYISNRTISDGTHEIQFEGPGQVNFISGGVATVALKGGDGPVNGSGGAGGSGGGGGAPNQPGGNAPGGPANQPGQNSGQPYTTNHGNSGGSGGDGGGGGGGSGGGGGQGSGPNGSTGVGGNAQPFPAFAGPLLPGMPSGWRDSVGANGKFASGGIGAGRPQHSYPSGKRGNGEGGGGGKFEPGEPMTGGGGGGGNDGGGAGGSGGPGIVIIRYAT